jgi:hypothetical protein
MLAAVVLAIGSFGPWAQVTIFGITATKNGISGDGVITLILAIIAAALLALCIRQPSKGLAIATILVGVIAAATSLYDLITISNAYSGIVSPGWGLYLAAIGSVALVIFSVLALRVARSWARGADPVAGASLHMLEECLTCGHQWEPLPSNGNRARGCPRCGGNMALRQEV